MAKVNLSNASIGDSWVIGIPSMNPSFALFGGFVDFILSGFLDFGKWDLGKPLWRTAFTFVVDCMSELERFCRCVQNLWSVFCFKWDWMMSRPSWNVCISFSVFLKVRLHQQRFWYPFAIGHWVDDWYFIIYKPKRFIFTRISNPGTKLKKIDLRYSPQRISRIMTKSRKRNQFTDHWVITILSSFTLYHFNLPFRKKNSATKLGIDPMCLSQKFFNTRLLIVLEMSRLVTPGFNSALFQRKSALNQRFSALTFLVL